MKNSVKKHLIIMLLFLSMACNAQSIEEDTLNHYKDFLRFIAPDAKKGYHFLVTTGIMHPFFNIVEATPALDTMNDYIQHVIHERNSSHLPISWWFPVNDTTKPLEYALQKNGFILVGYFYTWSYDFDSDHFRVKLPHKLDTQHRLQVVKITTTEQVKAWGAILRESMGYSKQVTEQYCHSIAARALVPEPAIDMYIAYHKNTPIGAVMSFYKDGFYMVADLCIIPSYQHNGFGQELVYTLLSQRKPDAKKAMGIASMRGESVIKEVGSELHSFIAIYMLL